jgi:hypothetical protein
MASKGGLVASAAVIRLFLKAELLMVIWYWLFVFEKKRDDLPVSVVGQNHPALFINPHSEI